MSRQTVFGTRQGGERGASSALGLVVGILVMGVLAVIVLKSQVGGVQSLTGPSIQPAAGGTGTTARASGTISGVANDIHKAAVVVCRADYEAVQAAIGYYEVENGSLPTSIGSLSAWLRGSPTSPYFTIAIDPHRPGVVEVGAKGHPLSPGSGNCAFVG